MGATFFADELSTVGKAGAEAVEFAVDWPRIYFYLKPQTVELKLIVTDLLA